MKESMVRDGPNFFYTHICIYIVHCKDEGLTLFVGVKADDSYHKRRPRVCVFVCVCLTLRLVYLRACVPFHVFYDRRTDHWFLCFGVGFEVVN